MKHLNLILRYMFFTFALGILISDSAYCQSLPAVNHETKKDSALKYIHNYNASVIDPATAMKGGAFHREAIDKILAQKNCVGIRIYFAKLDDATPTFVVVGVDNNGDDLSEGIIAEAIIPCPPFCGDLNPSIK